MNTFERQIEESKKYIPAIEEALRETYFSSYNQAFLQTEAGRIDIKNNVFRRYEDSLRHVLPWLCRHIGLTNAKVLEIGCGTGSSTAALAHYVQQLHGYDIHSLAVHGARRRLEIMGLNNARLHIINEESLIRRITEDAVGKYEIILLFAVLEHQTVVERHDTLKTCWDLLAGNGIMAVIDTPNILHYFDLHTSKLPFLHLLPSRLYARYAVKSPRSAFARSFADEGRMSAEQLELAIARWGRGASFHDFELALGETYKDFLVAEGFEPEILDWFVSTPEEELLRWYVQLKGFDIPMGFTRCVLNLIFKKFAQTDSPSIPQPPAPPPPFTHFNPDPHKRIEALEQELHERNSQIEKIYRSWTWRTGNLFASPYRKICSLFRK